MKDVYLHGALGERFGKKWRFAVSTPNEVFRAIHANTDGFLEYLSRRAKENVEYAVVTKAPEQIWEEWKGSGDETRVKGCAITEHDMNVKFKSPELHVVPLVEGAGAEFVLATFLKKLLIAIVVAVIVGGIMKMLFKPPEKKDPVQTKSYLFSGARNVERQGIPVPLGYGRMRIGSAVVGAEKRSFFSSGTNKSNNASTLESYSNFKYTELLCEGPIGGFVNANGGPVSSAPDGILEGIYFNETPVKNTPIHLEGTPNPNLMDVGGTYNYILNEEDEMPLVKLGEQGERSPFSKGTASTVDYAVVLWGAAPYAGEKTTAHHDTSRSAIDSGAKLFTHSIINEDVRKIRMSLRTQQFFQENDGEMKSNKVRFAIRLKVDDSLINVCDDESTTTATRADIVDGRYDGTVEGNPKAVNIGDTISYHGGENGKPFGIQHGGGINNKVQIIYGKEGYFELEGIATSDYEFDLDFWLPATNSYNKGIQVQVIKLSSELDPSAKTDVNGVGGATQNRQLTVSSVTESIEENFLYPHSAMVQVSFDSKNFSQLPDRSYHLRLKKVLVPSNYDPVSRKYDGPWDGLFYGQGDITESIHSVSDNNRLWTDNPAWIFYDILNNTRFGLGKFGVLEENIDKWQLYKIAKYCDELVETGYPDEFGPKVYDGSSWTSEGGAGLDSTRRYFSTDNESLQEPDPKTAGNYLLTPKMAAKKAESKRNWADSQGVADIKRQTYFKIALSELSNGDKQYSGASGLEAFKKEFGDGESFKGKKVAFFLKTLDVPSGKYHDAGIEERYIVGSDAASRTVTLLGPSFGTHGATNSSGITVGQCSTQISYALVEPRFSANVYITDKMEALQILNHLASIFRGIVAYTNGQVLALQDSFKKPVQLFNNSNVLGDGFNYTGTVKNKKFSAVLVRYNDKDNNFRPSVAYMEDADAIQKFGYVENDTLGFGCTSTSQAQRLAKWILHTSQLEIESVVFKAGQEASYLFPGSIFEVSDEVRAGQYRSGRVLGIHPRTRRSDGSFFSSAYLQLDKDHIGAPIVGRVELVVAAGQVDTTDQNITLRAPFERVSEDQDVQIDSIKAPQLLRFDGVVASDNSKSGPQGQSTVAKDLMLKLPLDISLSENKIKAFLHGLENGDRVRFVTEGARLPEPLSRYRIGTSAYYVVNKTKHTFMVSKTEGGVPEDIRSVGQDEFGNTGGFHYFCPESYEKTKEAVEKIMIGAPWSIKGRVGTAIAEVASETALGYAGINATSTSAKGWVNSTIFGALHLSGNGWAFSPTMGWLNISAILNRDVADTNLWFYKDEIGWIWTNDTYASSHTAPGGTPYWYVKTHDKNTYDSAKQTELGLTTTEGWVVPHKNTSGQIEYLFVYDTNSTYSEGDEYRLGRQNGIGGLFTVNSKKLDSGGVDTLGYWLEVTRSSNTVVTITPSDSSPVSKPSDTEEGYNDAILDILIRGISKVTAANSLQNKNSIKFSTYTDSSNFTLHKLDGSDVIRVNGDTVVIDSASYGPLTASTAALREELRGVGTVGKYWHVLKINSYEFELVDSEDAYDLIDAGATITSEGTINKHRLPDDSAERKLQGQFFRTMQVKESDDNQYEVTGIEYNPGKFDSIDKKTIIKKPLLPIPPQEDMTIPPAPRDLLVTDLTKG